MVRLVWLALVGGAVGCALATAAPTTLENVYCWKELGYCIRYPGTWIGAKVNDYTLLLSGKPGSEAYYATVTIASFASTLAGGRYETPPALLSAYKCDLVSGSPLVCIDGSAYPDGSGYTAEFVRDGETFRQWRVVVARPDGKVFPTWAYTAPVDLYATYRPIAEAMYSSWTLDGTAGSTGPGTAATGTNIATLLEVRDRIRRLSPCTSDTDLTLGRCHSLSYTVNIPQAGYVALSLVLERGQWVQATLYDPSGKRVAFRPGNVSDVYSGVHAVAPETYTIKVAPQIFTAESDFVLTVYFSPRPFSVDELVALYGPRNRYLDR